MAQKPALHPAEPTAGPGMIQGKTDRFRWVFTASVLLHVVIVLGISFVAPSEAKNDRFAPPLKITLVATSSEFSNENATTLAQADSEGDIDPSAIPVTPGFLQPQQLAAASKEREKQLVIERIKALYQTDATSSQTRAGDTPTQSREELTHSINLAYLNAKAKPRERFVSTAAKASAIAPYLEKWRLLVERVGTLNYPDAAKKLAIEGDLVMDVVLNVDGSLESAKVLRSSGEKILDDGAERIVRIAAPFDPFNDEMKRSFDTLHIIRTWRFSQNTLTDITQ